MGNSLVSIIIPVYKVEPYLDKCVQSVIDQTYKDLEIILVDDGSTDRCPQMCDEWAHKDKRIRVIHQENRGLSGARNTGIRVARGEWLYFLDSDDWIIPECIELMKELVDRHSDVELVQGGVLSNDDSYAKWLSIENKPNVPDYSCNRDWVNLMLLRQEILVVTAWNKLIRRDIVLHNDLFFEEGALNEDEMWSFLLSKYVTSVAICKKNTYYYNIRKGSIVKNQEKVRANYPVILECLISYIGGIYKRREIARIAQMTLVFQSYNVTIEQRERFRNIKIQLIKKADLWYALVLFTLFFMPDKIRNRAKEYLFLRENLI